MTKPSPTTFLAVMAMLGVFVPATAKAAPILYSSARATAQNQDVVGFPIDTDSTGTLFNVDTTPLVEASIGLASSYAKVTDGVLSAYAAADSEVAGIFGQTATAEAGYGDTLTLLSNTLATGTLVTLHFGLGLDATSTETTVLGAQRACGESNATLSVAVLGGSQLVASAKETSCAGSTDSNSGMSLTYAIGDNITVLAALTATAYGRAGADSYADAAHTLRL
jgi:hypothetical protein